MALADDILSDLDGMFDDWGDSITIAGTAYDGLYDREYVETKDMAGFMPVFTLKTSEASGAVTGTAVAVTSVINGITAKVFKVRVRQVQGDGTTKLVLEEA